MSDVEIPYEMSALCFFAISFTHFQAPSVLAKVFLYC